MHVAQLMASERPDRMCHTEIRFCPLGGLHSSRVEAPEMVNHNPDVDLPRTYHRYVSM